ncbi:DUF2155 domain-containing protein, partial [Phenylobacterium sp.]|uniref:DUF2155 domain-containing protein n=1 Tax=Phenylobacterium sp. TaxID=1871053 RepID=UPI003983BCCA
MQRPSLSRPLHRLAWLAGLIAIAGAGLVSAQPAPPVSPPTPTPLPPPEDAPAVAPPVGAAPPEEAPPINVPPPAPILVPPISEKEVVAAPEPKDKPPETPAVVIRRARYDVAVLQAIDKVTAETLRFEAPVGRPVRYKGLIFTVKACERAAPDEAVKDSIVYMTIDSQPRAQPGKPSPPPRQAFKGWMYAASPGLNPLEHAVYDA